jgi:nicotinamide-nucleotide amidase
MTVTEDSPTADLDGLLDGRTVAAAESVTAGLVAQALAAAKGASDWFLGGVVAYNSETKFKVLDVPRGPVVNARTAAAMATGVAMLVGSDVAVSTTGAAGPDGLDGAEPGTVFIGWRIGDAVDTEEFHFEGDPADVVQAACNAALDGLARRLEASTPRSATPRSASRD